MARRRLPWKFWSAVLFAALIPLAMVSPAHAQPPATNPNEMCGTGATFSVELPGRSLGISDEGFFDYDVVSGNTSGPPDSVNLPMGCRMYVFIVGGYGENAGFDKIPFYKVAAHVAKNGGYFHVSWWNNLNAEYMGRPLHQTTTGIESTFGLFSDTVTTNPGGYDENRQVPGVGFASNFLDKPKAVPVEDNQFRDDARLVIAKIRALNPTAKIVILGHGMGAHAAAKVAYGNSASTAIDLLALIDPVGNQDRPMDPKAEMMSHGHHPLSVLGLSPSKLGDIFIYDAMNWSRWRATHIFRGYKRWECERIFDFGPCKTQLIGGHIRAHCRAEDGAWRLTWPTITTNNPVFCPIPIPWIDPGTTIKFTSSVKNLYHVWQTEYFGPIDFLSTHLYNFQDKAVSSALTGSNYQRHFSTCRNGQDPDDTTQACSALDGHGELVGMRGGNLVGQNKTYPGLAMQDWPANRDGRREKLVELATADEMWAHRPENPDMCLVCDDIITMIDRIVPPLPPPPPDTDDTAPETFASAIPGPNASGWNAEDVTIEMEAHDEDEGSGVEQLSHALSGAETVPASVTMGEAAQVTISVEGQTTLHYFATDNDGNVEAPRQLTVRIDKTTPELSAVTDVAPNAAGWNSTNVAVRFEATDALSGVLALSPEVVVETEGALQQITGSATDRAGNQGTVLVTLNIDKTPPAIAIESRTPAANTAGWSNSAVTATWNCSDPVSGVLSASDTTTVGGEGLAQSALGTCRNNADLVTTDTLANINIDLTPPTIALDSRTPSANAGGWNTSPVAVTWNCADALSGVLASSDTAVVANEGAAQLALGTCRDLADHVTTDTVSDINVDLTPPAIALDSRAPAANSAGWNNSPVTVNWNCTDAVSGVVAGSDTATIGSEGAAQSVLGTCHDNAGHVATDTVSGISVDSTAPGITLQGHAPAPNTAGWNNTDVTVTWNCSDALSGPVAGQVSGAVSAEGAAQNVSGQCVDRADNAASNTRAVNIDKTGPIAQITSPPDGAVYMVNAVVNAAYGCTDALSGVSTCVGPVASGAAVDTATVGGKSFTVNAADAAGNSGATSLSYVVRYAFSGFLNPVAAMPAINSAKAGRTVPIKYTLRDANGALISDLGSFVSLASVPVACDTNVPSAEAEEIDAAGSTAIRFETDKFVFNWQTSSAWEGSCRVLQLNLSDGTQRMVTFQFK